jgi:hypothetical protein
MAPINCYTVLAPILVKPLVNYYVSYEFDDV